VSAPGSDPRREFAALARRPDPEIPLAEAALWVAAEAYPALDVAGYVGRLDRLGRELLPRLAGADTDWERAARLVRFLHGEKRFAGNREQYDDPRNSFLNEVLERGRGLPITLSILYMEVGRRAGLPVAGIGFPGHFLARLGAGELPIVIDAFDGRIATHADCEARLRAALGPRVAFDPALHLRAATPREILVRLIGNLKHVYVRIHDYERALACCDRILMLVPDAPTELRDRALVYERLECFAAAAADFERFVELMPPGEASAAAAARLSDLRRRVGLLH
jgi:regulator of sirC expression with transglutaminase-like and TPR domain